MSDVPTTQQRIPSTAQAKRTRPRKTVQATATVQPDGTVSDTVTTASHRSPKPPRQQCQGGAPPPASVQPRNVAERTRPASVGGPATQAMNTPAKEQAYAGSRFQASPAASKLPIPHKFFSKSVPDVGAQASLAEEVLDGDKTPEQMSSPEQDVATPSKQAAQLPDVKSPLAMFFDADKAERDRRASGTLSPTNVTTVPLAGGDRSIRGGSIAANVHGDSESGPRTQEPLQRPYTIERTVSFPGPASRQVPGEDMTLTTEALKKLLFSNVGNAPEPRPVTMHSLQQTPQGNPRQSPQAGPRDVSDGPSPAPRQIPLLSPQQTPQSHSQSSPWTSPPAVSGPHMNQRQSNGLHYGNANLSPMFAAVRNDAPMQSPPPRQPWESAPPPQQTYAQHPPQSPSSFSRQYLDQHIRSSMPTVPPPQLIGQQPQPGYGGPQSRPQSNGGAPQQPFMNGWHGPQHHHQPYVNGNAPQSEYRPYVNGNPPSQAQLNGWQGPAHAPREVIPETVDVRKGSSPAPRQIPLLRGNGGTGAGGGGSRDVQEMSDDLRRMLNMVR